MDYPKILEIRNEPYGAVWQVYHVQDDVEVALLSRTARENGFRSQELVEYNADYEETWPGWRDTPSWKQYRAEHEVL